MTKPPGPNGELLPAVMILPTIGLIHIEKRLVLVITMFIFSTEIATSLVLLKRGNTPESALKGHCPMRIRPEFMKRQVKKLLWRMGLEIRRRPNLRRFLECRKIDVFLDVGANIGQTGLELRDQGYGGRIVSFEPVKAVFEELKSKADLDGNWEAHNFALGSAPARTPINVSENTVFSSMVGQTNEARRFDESARVLREEIAEVQRLDDIFSRFRGHRVFLKIVTQGFEREVLEGAQESLKEIMGVELRLPIVQMYRGSWSFPEAVAYMSERGFVLGQTGQESFEGPDKVTLLELYCIFRGDTAVT